MTSLFAVFSAALAFVAALFGRSAWRSVGLFVAGVTAAIVAWVFAAPASYLAVVGGGVLIGSSLLRRSSTLSVALGTALIAAGAITGELEVGSTTLFPLRFAATLLAGIGCGWITQSWQPRDRRQSTSVVLVTLTVLMLGVLATHEFQAGMALLPVMTTEGVEALLVFRGVNAVEAYRWMVPVPYSLISLACIGALIPIGVFLSVRGRRRSENDEDLQPAGPVFGVFVGASLLVVTFLVWGHTPEILRSTPSASLLEQFRPSSVSADWELVLRPLAESYRVDWFSLLPLLVTGLLLALDGLLVGLREETRPGETSSVSLWPASLAFTLSAMLFAAFQVDSSGDTWEFAAGATPALAAALCVAGLELQVGLTRRVRTRIASLTTLGVLVAWVVFWSATV